MIRHRENPRYEECCQSAYNILHTLPLRDHKTPRRQLPENGIYVFFQKGETVVIGGKTVDRVVRVGTHRADNRFGPRIRQHFGRVRSLMGNKNASVFRRHLGGAILRKGDTADYRLEDWVRHGGPTYRDVEMMVSAELRDNFSFRCFRVDDAADRHFIESRLIALFAQYPLGKPSGSWLGIYAAAPEISRTGLWNTRHVTGEPLAPEQIESLVRLIEAQRQ